MRSTTWISVLVALFMFQSLWNVAAAFCVHEEQKAQVVTQQSFHFGHHQTTLCVSDDKAHQQINVNDHTQTANDQFELGEDHPSLDKMTPDEFYYDQLPQQNKVA